MITYHPPRIPALGRKRHKNRWLRCCTMNVTTECVLIWLCDSQVPDAILEHELGMNKAGKGILRHREQHV